MTLKTKLKIWGILISLLLVISAVVFFRYYFTPEQKNITRRGVDAITGMNLTVTIFGYDGRIIKRWTRVQKVTTGRDAKPYSFFYTREGKYVQIPNSVWYIAEEE